MVISSHTPHDFSSHLHKGYNDHQLNTFLQARKSSVAKSFFFFIFRKDIVSKKCMMEQFYKRRNDNKVKNVALVLEPNVYRLNWRFSCMGRFSTQSGIITIARIRSFERNTRTYAHIHT